MEQTDKLTKPEEKASVRVKLDQLEIKNMLSKLDKNKICPDSSVAIQHSNE